ncbi:MAG: hypothetical protein AAFV49_17160, partial [Pseudomonadota bacterium]
MFGNSNPNDDIRGLSVDVDADTIRLIPSEFNPEGFSRARADNDFGAGVEIRLLAGGQRITG